MERVTFFNEESGFAVLRVKVRGQRDLVTVPGSLPAVSAGEWLTAFKNQDLSSACPMASLILNFRDTLRNNRRAKRRKVVSKWYGGRERRAKPLGMKRMEMSGSATGNRTRVLRLRISRPNP